MQATIRIDNALIEEAMSLTDFTTKKAAVEAALRQMIRLSRQQHVRTLRGKLRWDGDLSEMRMGKTHADD